MTSPAPTLRSNSGRVSQAASVTSTPSTTISVDAARALKPIMIDAGKGHG